MKLFDLHCDTIERMEELGENMLTDKTQRGSTEFSDDPRRL